MGAESPNEIPGWDGVCRSLESVFGIHEESGRFFSSVFDELDALCADMARRQEAWLEGRRQVERELAERAADLQRQGATMVELLRRQEQAASAPASAPPSAPDGQLLGQVRQLEDERRALERERAVLESELEAVRNRAAEMTETLAEQKRQMAEQRDQWAEELRRMRHLLETLTGRLAESPSRPEPAAPAAPAGRPAPAAGPGSPGGGAGDAVLDSVMAQFQMLQKDRARRREKPVEAGQV